LNFFDRFSKETEVSSLIEIRRVGAELFHVDGRMDRHDEADVAFFLFCERT
jgi:hypothetical protein